MIDQSERSSLPDLTKQSDNNGGHSEQLTNQRSLLPDLIKQSDNNGGHSEQLTDQSEEFTSRPNKAVRQQSLAVPAVVVVVVSSTTILSH